MQTLVALAVGRDDLGGEAEVGGEEAEDGEGGCVLLAGVSLICLCLRLHSTLLTRERLPDPELCHGDQR